MQGSVGSSIDHLGWNFKNFDETIKKFKDQKVEFTQPPTANQAYILGPDGVKIEIVREEPPATK